MELPSALEPLRALAWNLRWSWHAATRDFFARLDPAGWERTAGNPVALLACLPAGRLVELATDAAVVEEAETLAADLAAYLRSADPPFVRSHGADVGLTAYFCAEFGITECLRIYAGGLGILAGDHLKAASDLGVPLVGVGLFYRDGYFGQSLGPDGLQTESYTRADPARLPLREATRPDGVPVRIAVPVAGRQVVTRVWRADVGRVPLFLLDTDLPANRAQDRRITDRLYGGDLEHRMRQELVLGIGGVRALEAVGIVPAVLHLNEGHAAFAIIERARQLTGQAPDQPGRRGAGGHGAFRAAIDRAADGIIFTTHTPVEAGHDYFPLDLLDHNIGSYLWAIGAPFREVVELGRRDPGDAREPFCMTVLALRASARRNGVSALHGAVTRRMWHGLWPARAQDDVPIEHITNGVHLATWVAPRMAGLFTRYVGTDWPLRTDAFHWHRIADIPAQELWDVRCALRAELVAGVRARLAAGRGLGGHAGRRAAVMLDPDVLTIVFARRFATYKRAALLLSDPDRLEALLAGPRPVQFVFAGKAHPKDAPGKALIAKLAAFAASPAAHGRFIVLEDYDMALARLLVHGADVWLNVPLKPNEASGTSGMKAAANGALNVSILDGWWAEAWTDHNRLTAPIGWAIDAPDVQAAHQDAADAAALYRTLEAEVVPLFHDRPTHDRPAGWLERVRAVLRQLPPYFSTHRMVTEYAERCYVPTARGRQTDARTAASGP